jgi:chaperonin GroEL (HSP60 family)
VITVEEARGETICRSGGRYTVRPRLYLSLLRYQQQKNGAELENPYILIYDKKSAMKDILHILEIAQGGRPLLIILKILKVKHYTW